MICLDCGNTDIRYDEKEKSYHCNNCGSRYLGREKDLFNQKRMFEDENGYVYPVDDGYRVHWKKEELKPDVDIKFSKIQEACYYLQSVR